MVDIAELRTGVDGFAGRIGIPLDKPDRSFGAWYTHARISWDWNPAAIRGALTDVPDGGVDVVYPHEGEHTVYLLQTKLRTRNDYRESPSDVTYLTRWANLILGPTRAFDQAIQGLAPLTAQQLRQAATRPG